MKKIIFLAICLIFCVMANAQFVSGGGSSKRTTSKSSVGLNSSGEGSKFQGNVGLGVQFAQQAAGPLLDTEFGCRIRDYVFVGGGLGFHSYMNLTAYKDYVVLSLPIYANAKGFLPVKTNVMPFINFSIGFQCLWLPEKYPNQTAVGFFTNVGAGIELGRHQVSAGYEYSYFHTGYLKYAIIF